MRRPIAASVALLSALLGLASSAVAADLQVKAPAAMPIYSWAGFYVGAQAGYGWGSNAVNLSSVTAPYAPAVGVTIPGSVTNDASGFIGGLEWGTNWQSGRWVFGTESDLSYSDWKQTSVVATPGAAGRNNVVGSSLDWFGTTRARLGYTPQDNLLLYVTGGLADASARLSASDNVVVGACAVAGNCPFGSKRDTLWGWALGGGVEWGSGPWSTKVEYIHYDLGDLTFSYGDGISPGLLTAKKTFSGDLVRGGLNYRFSWTPWQLLFGH